MNEQKLIAQDAIFQVERGIEYLSWLRGVLGVLRDRLGESEEDSSYATVADLAIYNADDWHKQLDAERESLENRTAAAFNMELGAPRKAELLNRGAGKGGCQ